MANFTALKTAINNAIKTNGNEEITGAILQAILDAMVETLGDSAITDLENAITTEVTNRENAVGGVADDLAAEVQARQALDYNVNNRINAEEYNRQNADATLSQTMNQGFQTLGSQMTALNAAISALNAAYQNGFLYGGIATPSSSPSNNKCFYIALQGGTYTNFGGVGVVEGINIIKNDRGWKVEHIYDQTTLLNEFYLLRQQVIRALASYDPIVVYGDVTNAPDEEDLTSNAQHLLKFKDRAYSPLNFSGLGMKILRKNILPLNDSVAFNGFLEGVTAEETLAGSPELIFWDRMNTRFVGIKDGIYYASWTDDDNYVPVSTSLVYMYNGTPYQWTGSDFIVDETEVPNLVNCLTQDMINEANTIYIIRYDYTLKEDITIPANCVLQFDGGSITASENNDTITFDSTNITGNYEGKLNFKISGTNITKNFIISNYTPSVNKSHISSARNGIILSGHIDIDSQVSLYTSINGNNYNKDGINITGGNSMIVGYNAGISINKISIFKEIPVDSGKNSYNLGIMILGNNSDYEITNCYFNCGIDIHTSDDEYEISCVNISNNIFNCDFSNIDDYEEDDIPIAERQLVNKDIISLFGCRNVEVRNNHIKGKNIQRAIKVSTGACPTGEEQRASINNALCIYIGNNIFDIDSTVGGQVIDSFMYTNNILVENNRFIIRSGQRMVFENKSAEMNIDKNSGTIVLRNNYFYSKDSEIVYLNQRDRTICEFTGNIVELEPRATLHRGAYLTFSMQFVHITNNKFIFKTIPSPELYNLCRLINIDNMFAKPEAYTFDVKDTLYNISDNVFKDVNEVQVISGFIKIEHNNFDSSLNNNCFVISKPKILYFEHNRINTSSDTYLKIIGTPSFDALYIEKNIANKLIWMLNSYTPLITKTSNNHLYVSDLVNPTDENTTYYDAWYEKDKVRKLNSYLLGRAKATPGCQLYDYTNNVYKIWSNKNSGDNEWI